MTTTTRKTYIDKERDNESNLGDCGVRKYNYAPGRFTSPDVLWEKYMGWSSYQYCLNNPISAKDPSGLLILNKEGSYLFTQYRGLRYGSYSTDLKPNGFQIDYYRKPEGK